MWSRQECKQQLPGPSRVQVGPWSTTLLFSLPHHLQAAVSSHQNFHTLPESPQMPTLHISNSNSKDSNSIPWSGSIPHDGGPVGILQNLWRSHGLKGVYTGRYTQVWRVWRVCEQSEEFPMLASYIIQGGPLDLLERLSLVAWWLRVTRSSSFSYHKIQIQGVAPSRSAWGVSLMWPPDSSIVKYVRLGCPGSSQGRDSSHYLVENSLDAGCWVCIWGHHDVVVTSKSRPEFISRQQAQVQSNWSGLAFPGTVARQRLRLLLIWSSMLHPTVEWWCIWGKCQSQGKTFCNIILSAFFNIILSCLRRHVCVCACVCVWEREREREFAFVEDRIPKMSFRVPSVHHNLTTTF